MASGIANPRESTDLVQSAMSDDPSTDELELVAEHGSGPLIRATAIVLLADRRNHQETLRELVDLTQSDE